MNFNLKAVIARRLRVLPPLPYAMVTHLLNHGELTTFRHPSTYSQLLAAKNLRERSPLLPLTADKLQVRSYVAERIGEQHLVPVIQSATSVDEIDFEKLPRPCVIKATHGSQMTILLRPEDDVDFDEVRARVDGWLHTNFYRQTWKEWVYRDIPPGVIVEHFLGEGPEPPPDYKFYMFHGKVGMVQVDEDRFIDHKTNLFDADWNPLRVKTCFELADDLPPRPAELDAMIKVAEQLATDFTFVRVDLYDVDGRTYFGEITHNPGGASVSLKPKSFELALGNLWRFGTPIPEQYIDRERGARSEAGEHRSTTGTRPETAERPGH